jgi:Tfp pilus assembly protein PilO
MLPVVKNQRVQAYTMVALSLFTISFFGFFAIRPTLKTIGILQRQISDRALVDKQLEEKINALILAQATYQRIESQVPTIYSLLPEKPEVTSLLVKLQQLVEGTGATISGVTFDPIVIYNGEAPASPSAEVNTPETVATTPINFSLVYRGKYADLVQVLNQLTKLDRVVTINSADLSIGEAEKQGAILIVNLKTRAYYLPLNL